MIWPSLTVQNVPLIDRQINRILEEYNDLKAEINEGNMMALEKLVEMKLEMKEKLTQFEVFYENNKHSAHMKYLFASRTILRKIAAQTKCISKINEKSINVPWKKQNKKIVATQNFKKNNINKKQISPLQKSKSNSSFCDSTFSSKQHNVTNIKVKNSIKSNSQSLKNSIYSIKDSRSSLKSSHFSKSIRKISRTPKKQSNQKENYSIKSNYHQNNITFAQLQDDQPLFSQNKNNDPHLNALLEASLFGQNQGLVFNFKFTKQQFAQIMSLKRKAKINKIQ